MTRVLLVISLLHSAGGCGPAGTRLPDAGDAVVVSVPSCVSLSEHGRATFPVRVAYRVGTSCAALHARVHPDRPLAPWLHVIDVADGTRRGNSLSPSDGYDDWASAGPTWIERCAAGHDDSANTSVMTDVERDLRDIIDPVPGPAEYDVFVTLGSLESNRARVRIAHSCWW